MTVTSASFVVVRVTHESQHDFATTRTRFETLVPVFDNDINVGLVIAEASWSEVEAAVNRGSGPLGLAAYARIDQGALFSLGGAPVDATLYLVGNALIAREITAHDPGGALYAPFHVAVYSAGTAVRLVYDQPSTVFASLNSSDIDEIALALDDKIRRAAEQACG